MENPSGLKRKSRLKYLIVVIFVFIPVLFFSVGMCDSRRRPDKRNAVVIQKDGCRGENSKQAPNLRSDGMVIFTVPKGFSCNDTVVGDKKVFNLDSEGDSVNMSVFTLFETRAKDEVVDDYWKNIGGNEFASCKARVVGRYNVVTEDYREFVRVIQYTVGEDPVYWRFITLFDEYSDKACIISAYYTRSMSPLTSLVKSIRFVN